ncbi:MAG: cell division protein ZapA [Bacteroidetes bacterium]|nr:cell division protein ZapA [Bacteroidota bacterium]
MQQNDLIPVTVWLAGRSYRLRIKPDEEETVRKAVKQADEKIQELRSHYAGKDDQDFIAMCLVSYAADIAIDNAFNPVVQQDLADMIRKIDSALEG